MKGIAVAIFPSDEKLLISYAELESQGTKDKIKIGDNTVLEVNDNSKKTVKDLTHELIKKAETAVPIVFGMHAAFQFTTDKLHTAAENVFGSPQKNSQLHCRTFYPLKNLSERTIASETINQMNAVFGVEIDFENFTPEQDKNLERIAELWTSVLDNTWESRFVGILPDDKYLITQILKKGGKWRERFGTHVCRHLGTKRNICVKPLGHNINPPFSDVTATYIADILDRETGEEARIVEATKE